MIPRIGNTTLTRLEPSHLTRLYADLVKDGLSPESVAKVHRVTHGMLHKAVRWGTTARNVAGLVSPPRGRHKEMAMLTPEQVRSFIRAAEGHRAEALFILAVTTGARSGELLGLAWDYVNLDRQVIEIRKTLQKGPEGFVLGDPKTVRSRRTVAIPTMAVAALERHRTRQLEEAMRLGPAWGNQLGLVFTTRAGTPLDPTNILQREFRPLLKEAGLPDSLRFHDLRHIAASLALAQGMPVPAVSEMLGHADAATTLRVYAHAVPGGQRQVAEALESVLVG